MPPTSFRQPRPLRIGILVIVIATLAAAAVSCGNDSKTSMASTLTATTTMVPVDPARASQRDAIRDAIDPDAFVGEALTCIADGVVASPAIDADGLTQMSKKKFKFKDLSAANRAGLYDVLDPCVKVSDFSKAFVASFIGGFTKSMGGGFELPATELGCMSDNISGQFDTVSAAFRKFEEDETATVALVFGSLRACLSADTATAFLSSTVVAAGTAQAQADCVSAAVIREIGPEGYADALAAAAQSDDKAPAALALQAASATAGNACV